MDEDKTKVKKPNWKFWTLLFTAIALFFGLLLTLLLYKVQLWLASILFPVLLSAFASIGVSLWFTFKTDNDNLYRELLSELDGEVQYEFLLLYSIDSILCSSLYPLLSKQRMMVNGILRRPRLFQISRHYTEYWEFYEKKHKELLDLVEQIKPQKGQVFLPNDDPIYLRYIFLVQEMSDKTLRLQEQILQDFKQAPKAPIPDQLILKIKATEETKAKMR